MNQIINMILRQITRRLVNKGIDAGFKQAGKFGRTGKEAAQERRSAETAGPKQGWETGDADAAADNEILSA